MPVGPLDMRMDPSDGLTAAEVIADLDPPELEAVLRDFGEEPLATRSSAAVVRQREAEPFTTSGRLVELLKKVVPAASPKSGGHPGKRTFQALRIEVNAELSVWAAALPHAIDALAVGGVAVLSYHSLEDRITKRSSPPAPRAAAPGLPVELPEHAAYLRLLTRGAEEAGAEEQARKPHRPRCACAPPSAPSHFAHPHQRQHHEGNPPIASRLRRRGSQSGTGPEGRLLRQTCVSSRPPSGTRATASSPRCA